MIYKNIEQGSKEWKLMRCGKVTASNITKVVAKTKSGYSAERENYMAQLIAERLTGSPAETFVNSAMQWGIETESQARSAYEFLFDIDVERISFCDHPTIENSGASPDGLIGTDGLIEIKCPNTATHIDYLLTKKIPKKYIDQMQWQMACMEREWCDFMSFDPRMPENLNRLIIRVIRDDEYIKELSSEVIKFQEEITSTIEKLKAL